MANQVIDKYSQKVSRLIQKYNFYECLEQPISMIYLEQIHTLLTQCLEFVDNTKPLNTSLPDDIWMWRDKLEVFIEDIFESKGIDFFKEK